MSYQHSNPIPSEIYTDPLNQMSLGKPTYKPDQSLTCFRTCQSVTVVFWVNLNPIPVTNSFSHIVKQNLISVLAHLKKNFPRIYIDFFSLDQFSYRGNELEQKIVFLFFNAQHPHFGVWTTVTVIISHSQAHQPCSFLSRRAAGYEPSVCAGNWLIIKITCQMNAFIICCPKQRRHGGMRMGAPQVWFE